MKANSSIEVCRLSNYSPRILLLALCFQISPHTGIGVRNVRALQEVMDAQTLAYTFPFSQFSFPTDIACVVIAEGRKSAFFHTELNVSLQVAPRTDPAALYKPADQVRLPPREKLDAFRDLVVGARCGKVVVSGVTSEVSSPVFSGGTRWLTEGDCSIYKRSL